MTFMYNLALSLSGRCSADGYSPTEQYAKIMYRAKVGCKQKEIEESCKEKDRQTSMQTGRQAGRQTDKLKHAEMQC